MSNYTQSTNFATKDSLPTGDPLKIVKGTEINTEFVNISTAIATKADLASPTFTGSPILPTGTTAVTQSAGNNSTALATTAYIDAAITAVKSALFPVGCIYTAVVSTNPATLLGFGTWTAFGAGRVLVGYNSSNALFDTAEETGGSADAIVVSHTHTATSTVTDPGHAHQINFGSSFAGANYVQPTVNNIATSINTGTATTGITVDTTNSSTGVTGTNANYQPYITVYMWKRTV
jgi:hypothetical protein